MLWPFGGGRRQGKTVAENRVDKTSQIVAVANAIHKLQSRVVWIERNAPYEKSDKKREQFDIEKIRIERQIKALEQQHHALTTAMKG